MTPTCGNCRYEAVAAWEKPCSTCEDYMDWEPGGYPLPILKIRKLHPDAVIPQYAKEGDSGFDLVAIEDALIHPGETKLVRTGIAVELPPNTELQVRPRSGLSLKTPLHIRNAPGTVDNGYRGEVGVICHCLHNPGSPGFYTYYEQEQGLDKCVHIKKGDRIAQGVVCPVIRCEIEEAEELSDTSRGSDGYGSTGV